MGSKVSPDKVLRSFLLILVLTAWSCSGGGVEEAAEVEPPPTFEVTYYYLPG